MCKQNDVGDKLFVLEVSAVHAQDKAESAKTHPLPCSSARFTSLSTTSTQDLPTMVPFSAR